MKLTSSFASLLLFLGGGRNVTSTSISVHDGKGPNGVHAVDSDGRYVIVADSAFDAVLVVDTLLSHTVGSILLHSKSQNPSSPLQGHGGEVGDFTRNWMDPADITSCFDCDFMYLTSAEGARLHRVNMPQTWRTMVEAADFSPLDQVGVNDIQLISSKGNFGTVTLKEDGSLAYICHGEDGIYAIDPKQDDEMKFLLSENNLNGEVQGCKLSANEDLLFVTSSTTFSITNAHDTSIDAAAILSYALDIAAVCAHDGISLEFTDYQAVTTTDGNTMIYGLGYVSGGAENYGMAMYLISLEKVPGNSKSAIESCVRVAGDATDSARWVDGVGDEIRFSRSHALTLLPSSEPVGSNLDTIRLLISDKDNRALRIFEVDAMDKESPRSNSVAYDENLWQTLYSTESKGDKANNFNFYVPSVQDYNSAIFSAETLLSHCQSTNPDGRLCYAREYRTFISHFSFSSSAAEASFWVQNGCDGCVLDGPGYCSESQVAPASGGATTWGHGHEMLLTVSKNDQDENYVVGECMEASVQRAVIPYCCVDIGGAKDDKKKDSEDDGNSIEDKTTDDSADGNLRRSEPTPTTTTGGGKGGTIAFLIVLSVVLVGLLFAAINFAARLGFFGSDRETENEPTAFPGMLVDIEFD